MIQHCKIIFSRHGIPEEVVMDNGSQFDSNAFRKFSKEYQFRHITNTPYYPRSNGEVEQGVKTTKALLKKGNEPYLVPLAYRSAPLSNGYSPVELLMNRKREEEQRRKQKATFDWCHRARDLLPALPGDLVWIPDRREPRVTTLTQKRPLTTNRSQKEGCRHHQLIPFERSST